MNRKWLSASFLIGLIGLLILSGGCRKKSSYKRLSPDELCHNLIRLYTADATLDQFASGNEALRHAYYDEIFKESGYTYADFDSSIAYYSKEKPALWLHICNDAKDSIASTLNYLLAEQQKMNAIRENQAAREGFVADSINLLGYNRPISYLLGKSLLDSTANIRPNTPWMGKTKVCLNLHTFMLPKGHKIIMEINVRTDLDSISYAQKKIFQKGGFHQLILQLPKDRKATEITYSIRSEATRDAKPGLLIIDSLSLVKYGPEKKRRHRDNG